MEHTRGRSRELKDAIRISRVIRAARKLRGVNQVDLARELDVHQSMISKLEKGEFIPSASQWFHLCGFLRIPPGDSFKTGLIDHCVRIEQVPKDTISAFKIPKRYLRYAASKVRVSRIFVNYFLRTLGRAKFLDFVYSRNMDPDLFVVLDNVVNINLNMELAGEMIRQGVLKREHLPLMTAQMATPEGHGRAGALYRGILERKELIKKLIENINLYENNFSYRFEEEMGDGFLISGNPSEFMSYLKYDKKNLCGFLNEYKCFFLSAVAAFCGNGVQSVEIIEGREEGFGRCIFKVGLNQ